MKRTHIFIAMLLLSFFLAPAKYSFGQTHKKQIVQVNLQYPGDEFISTNNPNQPTGVTIKDCYDCPQGRTYSTMPTSNSDEESRIKALERSNSALKKQLKTQLKTQGERLDSMWTWMQKTNTSIEGLNYNAELDRRVNETRYKAMVKAINEVNQSVLDLDSSVNVLKKTVAGHEERITALEVVVGYTVDYIYFIDEYGKFKRKARNVTYTLPPKTFSGTTAPVNPMMNNSSSNYNSSNQCNLQPITQKKKVSALGWKIGCVTLGAAVLTDVVYMIVHKTNDPTAIMKGGPSGNTGNH